jgi:DNA polymerase-3 subunit delta'
MSFSDFSNRQVVEVLQRSLERGRVAHAYLFTGSRLAEQEDVARTLIKTLNCLQPVRKGQDGRPLDSCDRCLSCRKIDQGIHADVAWIRPESKSRVITIDQIREALQTIHLKPTEAGYKMTVIVAADRLNAQAANAFLKTLEEPPTRSVLALLTTEPQRILETILSRCLRLNLGGETGPSSDPVDVSWLQDFSRLASEKPGDLLGRYRLLGVLLSRLTELKNGLEKDLTAKSPLNRYDDIDPKLRDRWEDELTAAIEAEYRRKREDTLLTLEWWMRDVLLKSKRLDDRLSFPQLQGSVDVIARRIGPRMAVENLATLEQTQRLLHSNVQEALALEVGLLKLHL